MVVTTSVRRSGQYWSMVSRKGSRSARKMLRMYARPRASVSAGRAMWLRTDATSLAAGDGRALTSARKALMVRGMPKMTLVLSRDSLMRRSTSCWWAMSSGSLEAMAALYTSPTKPPWLQAAKAQAVMQYHVLVVPLLAASCACCCTKARARAAMSASVACCMVATSWWLRVCVRKDGSMLCCV
ncbi:hypothetical protein SPBR_01057 [Sporothrix brasiliensis 5110]|uniref:Uncharacterized protein n=1 Tax=Sporothrix brasiliensis 5110 TaxID=1398154 RepID=A0A0C2IP65_9PEZI|nr:uncharacterized protein SPBR_01057 [Sporothrix brasiliensis 5110]KIH90821.1 hypothetical protein SPBR_01057 [Sporothrix brasiliensis 5110]